jgi:hypothetical protein
MNRAVEDIDIISHLRLKAGYAGITRDNASGWWHARRGRSPLDLRREAWASLLQQVKDRPDYNGKRDDVAFLENSFNALR